MVFGLLAVYLVWTLAFAIKFNKTDIYFGNRRKLMHNILIWIIPFLWIIIIKTITKPTPGSYNFKKKGEDNSFYESGLGG